MASPRRNTLRQAAGIWGPSAFAGAAVAAARLQPGYSHRTHHVSGLAAKGERSATVMVPGFLALGASSLAMPVRDPSVARLIRAAGITTTAAGLLRASQPRCPQPITDPEATSADLGHAVASVTTFVLWCAMPVVASRRPGSSWYRAASRMLAATSLAGFVVAGVTTQLESPRKGLAQRAFLGSVFAWHLATAVEQRRSSTGGTCPTSWRFPHRRSTPSSMRSSR